MTKKEFMGYDKMGQVHWLVSDIKDSLKRIGDLKILHYR